MCRCEPRSTSRLTHPIDQYLERYAEPEARDRHRLNKRFRHVVVIPTYDEPLEFAEEMLGTLGPDVLVIVVVNVPDNIDPRSPMFQRSQSLLQHLSAPNLLTVDRVNQPIPKSQGVGLARKIGADAALGYIRDGTIDEPYIYSVDADVRLPNGYIPSIPQTEGVSLYSYRHVSTDPEVLRRAELYELHMRHYVAGLRMAGSPYAFHTLGSTISVSATAYAQVRGFPRRDAAEDFYFLNKLSKVSKIHLLGSPEIVIKARKSHRVPFGTGPSIASITEPDDRYLSYHPQSFEYLRDVINAISTKNEDSLKGPSATNMEHLGYFDFVSRDPSVRQRHEWFDGFKTLRFIHLMRDFLPDVPLLHSLGYHRPNLPPNRTDLINKLRQEDRKPRILGVPATQYH